MESIINKYKSQGKILIYSDFRNGINGNIINNLSYTFSGTAQLDNTGLVVPFGNNYVNIGTDGTVNVGTSDYSVFAKVNKNYFTDYDGVLGDTAGYTGFSPLYIRSTGAIGTFLLGNAVDSSASLLTKNTNTFIGYTAKRDGVATFYNDGKTFGSTADISTLSASDLKAKTTINLARYAGETTSTFNGKIFYVVVIKASLSATEVAQLYAELESMKFQKKSISNQQTKKADLKNGLVFDWDGKLNNGIALNSALGDIGTVVGVSNDIDGARGNAVISRVSWADRAEYSFTNQIFTTSFWAKPDDISRRLSFGKVSLAGSQYEYLYGWDNTGSGNMYFACFTLAGTGDVYNPATTPYTANKLDHWLVIADGSNQKIYRNNVLVLTNAKSPTSNMENGTGVLTMIGGVDGSGTAPYNGAMKNIKMWNRALSDSERDNLYQTELPIVMKTEYGSVETGTVSAGQVDNSGWNIVSGTHNISTGTVNGVKAKKATIVTAGTISLPTSRFQESNVNSAYGEWNFTVGKVDNTSAAGIYLISDSTTIASLNGYRLQISGADGNIYFVKLTAGSASIIKTNAAVFTAPSVLKCKVTRTSAGVFEIFINGVSLGTVTDTTFTTSNYVLFNGPATDYLVLSDSQGQQGFNKK